MTSLVKTFDNKLFATEAKTLLHLAVPIAISQLAQMGMNFTDTVMAGRHGETSLAGVAIGSSLWVPSFLLVVGILMAITPLIAHAWGAEDAKEIKSSVQNGFWLAAFTGIIVMLLLQLSSSLFTVIEMESQAREQALGYTFAVSFGLPALALFQVLRGLNEGVHLTRPFMYVSLIAVLINIPLNYVFIYGKLGLPALGGVGCGWATCIVLWIEFLVMLIITLQSPRIRALQCLQAWAKPQQQRILAIIKLGMPIGVSLLVEASMFSLIALLLAKLGSSVVAGHQVAMSFISILFMIPLSISLSLTIRCGYYLGQQKPHLARYVGKMGLLFILVIATFYSLMIVSAADNIARLYVDNPAVRQIAVSLLFLAAIFQFSDGVQVAAAGILRGYKDTRFAFFTVMLAYWVVGLPLGYSLALTSLWGKALGAPGFWIAFIVGLTIAALLLSARFLRISKISA